MTLDQFNCLPDTAATKQLRLCCVAERWIDRVCQGRPYATIDQLLEQAQLHWQAMEETDYLLAFSGHPKIGDLQSLKRKYAVSATLAASEQASIDTARDTVIQALAAGNHAYEQKFGFIFIICASGKSAAQMLELLQTRLGNNRAAELVMAASEQMKITELRLQQMLS